MNVLNQVTSESEEPAFLLQLEDRLHRALAGSRLLEAGARQAVFPAGKRARPRLAHRFASLTGAPQAGLVEATAAVELIHAASLVHDDILDRGELRRGRPTVRVALGTEAAVLTGDLLLCRALRLLAPYPHEIARAAATFEEICHAATREWQARRRLDLTVDEWRSIAIGKTGALFGLAGYFAASLAGDRQRAQRFDAAARALGLAFQIADDFDDLIDESGQEDLARDLADGTPSLPILLALADDPKLGAALASWWHAPSAPLAPLLARIVTPSVRGQIIDAVDAAVATASDALGADADAPTLRPLLAWARSLAPQRLA